MIFQFKTIETFRETGCKVSAGNVISPEAPKIRKSRIDRFLSVGSQPTDIKGNGGMISRIRALVSF